MKIMSQTDPKDWENHMADNALVALIDKHGRCIWNNLDPEIADNGTGGTAILDTVVPAERSKVRDALSHCILEGQTIRYTVEADSARNNGQVVFWYVTLIPVPMRNDGSVAACAICYVIPHNYKDITAEDRVILRHLAKDKAVKEIAIILHRSTTAIDARMKSLKAKLGASNIGGLVAIALTSHII